jgi:hypothetical protein
VDLDRLADYTAGLLDGAQRVRVDDLIRTDPAWRQAHQALAAAQPRLEALLAGLGDTPVPAEVADRLDAALARETGPAGTGTAKVIDLSRRRRWTRLAAATTAAAAAVAAILGGVVALSDRALTGTASQNAERAPAAAASPPSTSQNLAASPPPALLHSGTDYTPQNLSALAAGDVKAAGAGGGGPAAPQMPDAARDGVLSRLDGQPALSECLAAIVALHGGTPTVVDYARFRGRPALVVVLTGAGPRQIVVVGPDCGVTGAAEVYHTTQ